MRKVVLDDTIRIETPEGVHLSAVLADPLSRALALLLDMVVIVCLLVGMSLLLMQLSAWGTALGLFYVVAFVLVWGYFFLCEWLWQGMTPGKRWMNVQVLSADLLPVTVAQAAWRNVLRYLDWLPAWFGLGMVVLVASPKNQRLGDWMAGTVVVFRHPPRPRRLQPLRDGEALAPPWRLSREEQRAIVEFARFADLHHEERLAELSAPLAGKLRDCDAHERVRLLRAWGRWLEGTAERG